MGRRIYTPAPMLDQFDPAIDPVFKAHDRTTLIRRLAAVLPRDGLVTSVEGMRVYESDGLAAYRGLGRRRRPATDHGAGGRRAEGLLRRRRACGRAGRGDGAFRRRPALPDCVLLSLSRFDKILEIDAEARTAVVQPGFVISRFRRRWRTSACSMRRIRRRSWRAASAAMSRKTPAVCTA